MALTRKKPRDFVYIDELREADKDWPNYFLGNKVWVFFDSYDAKLAGDISYSRIVVSCDNETGWILQKGWTDLDEIGEIAKTIVSPISQQSLMKLGFVPWHGWYE
ncbi:hypothetical protein [Marinomonas sp. PE14-40]|uniref:hypothetical protein n=1 Tax=Marinomonas sp. PE14-40 TaxID=3060621 RepID=UPI003F679EDB